MTKLTRLLVLATLLGVVLTATPPRVEAMFCTANGAACQAGYDCCSNICCLYGSGGGGECDNYWCTQGCVGMRCYNDQNCCNVDPLCFGPAQAGQCG